MNGGPSLEQLAYLDAMTELYCAARDVVDSPGCSDLDCCMAMDRLETALDEVDEAGKIAILIQSFIVVEGVG